MKNFSGKLIALFLLIASVAYSQRGKDGVGNITGTSIVNAYTTLTTDVTANTTSSITVANTSGFSTGDLILIIQMQGAWANYASADSVFGDPTSSVPGDTTYGKILAYNGAGNNEIGQISSVNAGLNTITLDCQITKSYKASGKTQIVRIPRYSSLTIGASGLITCPHWDRTLGYGGIVALEVTGNTTINPGGRIDASGLGFRGGAFWYKNSSASGSTLWGTTRRNEAANKGESIAGDTNVYANEAAKFGRGAIANGGGGGNAVNAGGGGGANGGLTNKYCGGIGNIDTTTNTNYIQAWTLENTAYPTSGVLTLWRSNTVSGGGRGGYTFSNDLDNPLTTGPNSSAWGTADNRRSVGGYGGRPLDYTSGQLYLGGGGGAGDGENFYNGAGGDGGGIIYFLSYGTISGGGEIRSNGANGSASYTGGARNELNTNVIGRDGAGGGGGGGAIYIKSTGTISGITINANGGNGGNQEMRNNGFTSSRMAYGPGGGGGGGFINIPSGSTVTTNSNGGTNGIVQYLSGAEGCQIDNNFPPNGATKGGPGTKLTTTTNYSITTTGTSICSGNTANLSAALTGTAPNPVTLSWYTDSIGGSPLASGTSYTTPVLNATTSYWVGTCPGTYREKVTVIVNPAPAAPAATSPLNYCQNSSASSLSATASGGNTIVWYDAATGGNILTQPITPSTSAVGSTSYFAAQSNGSCTGARTEVVVNVVALPNSPNVTTPVSYCQNQSAIALSATVSTGGNSLLYWGTSASGGTSSATAPTPSTSTVGTTNYYVSESNGTCESPRATITVTINAAPATPNATDTVNYCQNQVASVLTPGGAGYNWYTTATGGTAGPAPTPSTVSVGVTTYYVSQTQSGCESLRDSVKIVVAASFSAPTASNVNQCIGSTASVLSPNGTGYNWYTAASGGTASSSVTPSTSSVGTVSYYVSQGSGACESPRTQVDVITLALPNSPNVTSPVNYCQNETAAPLSVTASGAGNTILYWGTNASGGTSTTSATIPSTSIVGNIIYYVSENDGTCESPRASITVTINPIPANPSTADTVSYCQNASAVTLTPSGANYNWYTSATGGTPSTAPTPSTSNVGTTTYYVSETQNGCESGRDSVKVVVAATFAAPTASNVNYCNGVAAAALNPNGTGYNWYTTSTGGTASTSITPSTSVNGTTSYYVSQGSGSCESPRTQVDVTILALPSNPIGTDVSYCQNESAASLSANASGTLNWYSSPTGGSSSSTAPTPGTSTVGNTEYYVSQTDANGCESGRDTIIVTVINLQSPPTTSNIAYCQNTSAIALTASGTSTLNWWGTSATGGTSSSTAPTPSTSSTGTTTYYVSQGSGACESPRASIVVTINPKPTISFTQNTNTICEDACVTFTANTSSTCSNLVWNFGDGNTSTNTVANNCYSTAGNYTVKAICTTANGCVDSSVVNSAVIVNAAPEANFSISPGTMVTPNTTISFVADTGSTLPAIAWNFNDPASGTQNTSTIYNPTHTYSEIGTYCITLITGANLCKDTISKCIEVIMEPSLIIPNVFTPNGDGINDVFNVIGNGITKVSGSIYDRWGVKLYSWDGVTGGWDGKTKNGNKASNGVYYYIINTTDIKNESKEHSGYLQLIDNN